jgi:hypothetical protein
MCSPSEEAIQEMDDREIQRTLSFVVKSYVDRQASGTKFPAIAPDAEREALTATEAVVVAAALLDAASVEVFELGMWKAWGAA